MAPVTHYLLLLGVSDSERAELAKRLKAGKVAEVTERLEELVRQGRAARG